MVCSRFLPFADACLCVRVCTDTFSPTTQVLTAVMMYLATVPYILTVRSSMIHDTDQVMFASQKVRDTVCRPRFYTTLRSIT